MGGQARLSENSLNNVFLLFIFSPQPYFIYSLQRGPMALLQRKLYFSKDPEGVQQFPGGSK